MVIDLHAALEVRVYNMEDTIQFVVENGFNIESYKCFPVIDDNTKALVGGITVDKGDRLIGFLARNNNSCAFKLEIGEKVYFTPVIENGFLVAGTLSELPIYKTSQPVIVYKE